jgi:hypothetical protein
MVPMTNFRVKQTVLFLAFALAVGACAPLQPPSATGPRGNEPIYPILFTEDSHRREATVLAVTQLTHTSGSSETTGLQLQPVTATIKSLPTNPATPLYLPKVGAAAVMNEEETRESLRRFIRSWQELIGADAAKLSLVERVDQPDELKLASYEQRPFRYPIRGNYGRLQIRFTPDRRIVNLSSTCIPDAERIQTALVAVSAKLKSEDAVKQLRDNGMTYTDANGNNSNVRVPPGSDLNPLGLVIYVRPSTNQADALEFHLAWEIQLSNASIKMVYIDAVNGEAVAAT